MEEKQGKGAVYMKKKKRSWITVIAVFTAIVGAVVAVGAFLKKKAKTLGEQLDYEDGLYYDDEDDYEDNYSGPESDAARDETGDEAFEEENSLDEEFSAAPDEEEKTE